jgi:hypothetical protein
MYLARGFLMYRMEFDDDIMVGALKPVKRFLIVPMGGYFPVLIKLNNGDLAVVFRMGDYHIGQRGRLEISLSKDGGRTWSMPRIVTFSETDDRNPAFCQLKDGTLLVAFARIWGYENGRWQRGKMRADLFTTRSKDYGETWSRPEPIEVPVKLNIGSPYGRMLQLDDGTILLPVYGRSSPEGLDESYILRSEDNGHTWGDVTLIAGGGYNETSLLQLSDGKMLAALRTDRGEVAISYSYNYGYDWTKPKLLTRQGEHPGDLCLLKSGRILLAFGHRRVPYGVHAVISNDEGKTWGMDKRAALVSYAENPDCGYPSSVQLEDGTIYTAYYATTSIKKVDGYDLLIHAGGVAYTEEIFAV